jgi:hypothetical protein
VIQEASRGSTPIRNKTMEMSANQIEDIVKCMKASADMLEQVEQTRDDRRKRQAGLLREAARQIQEFSE